MAAILSIDQYPYIERVSIIYMVCLGNLKIVVSFLETIKKCTILILWNFVPAIMNHVSGLAASCHPHLLFIR